MLFSRDRYTLRRREFFGTDFRERIPGFRDSGIQVFSNDFINAFSSLVPQGSLQLFADDSYFLGTDDADGTDVFMCRLAACDRKDSSAF